MNDTAQGWSDNTDAERLNDILDKLCDKLFANPVVAISCFRAALDMFGISLPILDVEKHGEMPQNYEDLFRIEDIEDEEGGPVYLYIAIDQVGPYFEAYAQVVDDEELDDIGNEDIDVEHPPIIGDGDSGETQYQRQIKRAE